MGSTTEAYLQAPPWELPARWRAFGRSILEGRKIDLDLYQSKTVKERLLDALAAHNIIALAENARELSGVDDEEVWARLALNRRTPNRWIKGEVLPHARMFFGTLVIGLRREIGEVSLPGNRVLIWRAVSTTVAIIREKELGRDRRPPAPAEFACVRCLMRQPDADLLAARRDDEAPPDPRRVDELISRVAWATGLKSAAAAVSIIREWAEPYVLFRLGLHWELGFLDEDV